MRFRIAGGFLTAVLILLAASHAVPTSAAATYVVNSTADPGTFGCDSSECTLREAILAANSNPGPDSVEFNIPQTDPAYDSGTGAFTIGLSADLPYITDPASLDATTQPGYSSHPLIELHGNYSGASGLVVSSGASTIRGFAVNGFLLGANNSAGQTAAIELIGAAGNTVAGNFIGTDVTGTTLKYNLQGAGVAIKNSDFNTIGGNDATDRNLISGHIGSGIGHAVFVLGPANGNVISGNYLGTDITGNVALGNDSLSVFITDASNTEVGGTSTIPGQPPGNLMVGYVTIQQHPFEGTATGNVIEGNLIGTNAGGSSVLGAGGVRIVGASNNRVGGTEVGSRNVISGMSTALDIFDADSNVIQGNFIGTDVTGSLGLNTGGVVLYISSNNLIGGAVPGARNVISSSPGYGIVVAGGGGGNVIEGNFIGTDLSGNEDLGNGAAGVYINTNDTVVGGVSPGASNVIAFNGEAGVKVDAQRNSIRGNSIHSNTSLGIDLLPNGISPNDAGDTDGGSNLGQNFPILTSVVGGYGSTTVTGSLNSTPSTSFQLDFYANSSCDPSGNGEGRGYLGLSIMSTDSGGNGTFSAALIKALPPGELTVTATATDPGGNTSEFSQCLALVGDIDGDGIPDSSDACPSLPGDSENQGCPAPQPPIAVGGTMRLLGVRSGPSRDANRSSGSHEPFFEAAMLVSMAACLGLSIRHRRRRA